MMYLGNQRLPFICIVLTFIPIEVHAQELHKVYMVNHKTTVHYHAFSRIDRVSNGFLQFLIISIFSRV